MTEKQLHEPWNLMLIGFIVGLAAVLIATFYCIPQHGTASAVRANVNEYLCLIERLERCQGTEPKKILVRTL